MEVLWYAILGKGWGEGVGGFFLLMFLSFVLFYVLCLLEKKKSDILFIFFGILFTINKSLQKKDLQDLVDGVVPPFLFG